MSGQSPEQRATVGVLFVHGIGAQPRGKTLAEFAGPVVTWLQGWYDGLHACWARGLARCCPPARSPAG